MSGPISQDWEPVVIRKKAPTAAAKKDEKVVNAARRAGAEIETLKKATAGTNRAASSCTTLNTRKLDEETENLTHERVPTELKKAIMQARMDKKLTQSQLAQKPDGNGEKLEQEKTSKLSILTKEVQAQLEIPFSLTDIKGDYKGAKLLPKWKAFQTIIFLEREDGLHDSKKIAAFDFDGCLAKTNVQRVGAQFWSLMYPSIPDKLQSLYNDGYKLVIFTNESNIDRWKNKRQVAVDSKLGRLNNFIKHVKVPIQVFVACGYSSSKVEDPFRKPKPGMWQIMEKHFNSGIPIDMDQSFYVGDAAGRINDHSDADLEFAKAIGLKFFVPEDYFGA